MSARDQVDRSTPATLIARAAADFIGRVRRQESRLRRHWIRPLLWALGQAHYDLRGFLAWAIAQIQPDEAEEDRLDRWGTFWQVSRDLGAQATCTDVILTGTPATPVPAGTVLVRGDGWTYTTDLLTAIGGGGTVTVPCTSVTVGVDGNLDVPATLELETPIAGVDNTATLDTPFEGGTDPETDAQHRARVLARIREEAEGGTAAQYAEWAREALPVVRDVWIVPGAGRLNTRTLYFTVQGQGIASLPSPSQEATVAAYIATKRPVTHDVTVDGAAGASINMTIQIIDDSLTQREAIEAELRALFARRGGDREADGTCVIANSEVRNAIGRGADAFVLLSLIGDGTGMSDLTITVSGVPLLGTISWV